MPSILVSGLIIHIYLLPDSFDNPIPVPVLPSPDSAPHRDDLHRPRLAILAEQALAGEPAQRAVEFEGRWHDWGALRATADALSAALDAAGVSAAQPVAVVPRNCPGFAAALLGLLARARPIVMVHAYQSPEGIARDLARLGVAAAIALERDWQPAVIAAAAAAGIAGISLGAGIGGAASMPGLETGRAAEVAGAAAALRLLTSGTTGAPKHHAMSYDLVARAMLGETMLPSSAAEALPALIFFPFGNISGIYAFLPAALARRPMVMLEKFDIQAWAGFARIWRPPVLNVPPAALQMALDADITPDDLASVSYIYSGAATLEPYIQRRFEARYGIPILLSYGATEFAGPVTLMTPELHRDYGDSKFGSVGRAVAGAGLRVVDPANGAVLPPDEEGVLEVRVPRIGPDWIRTTDLAVIDRDGFLFHRGRADGAIMRGGFKIIPDIVVAALVSHPAVAAAAVVGLPDKRLGEVPAAAIQLRAGAAAPSEAALEAHVRQCVYATHVPVAFVIVPELPRTPSMKIDIPAVRQLLLDRQAGG